MFLFTRSSRLTSFFVSRAYILLDDICMISITDDNAIIHDFSQFFNLRSFPSFQCLSATHFETFCNNNHIWYTNPGLSPSKIKGCDLSCHSNVVLLHILKVSEIITIYGIQAWA